MPPTRAVYANCFWDAAEPGSLLVTAEDVVGAAWPGQTFLVDAAADSDEAHARTLEAWDLAFSWFRSPEGDPTVVHEVSAGDLAAMEVAQTILLPAARGLLEARAAARAGLAPDSLTLLTAAGGPGHYARYEAIAAQCFARGLAVGDVRPAPSRDPRNAQLFAKYARTRDPEWLVAAVRGMRQAQEALFALVNAPLRLRRRRPSLYVLEYNPTRALAGDLAARRGRGFRLLRAGAPPRELPRIVAAGDAVAAPPRMDERRAADAPAMSLDVTRLELAGADVWPVVEPHLRHAIGRYVRYARAVAPRVRRRLSRADVRAVVVPFDGPPAARLVVRVAQSLGIPTFVINDGYKSDEAQRDGFAADVALAWSQGVVDHYFARRGATAMVTGNPRARVPAPLRPRCAGSLRLLVGGFAFSPVDLNCRRSDPERFTREVLAGIAAGIDPAGVRVRLKLHPADDPAHYAAVLAGQRVEVISSGDVGALFGDCDLYVTMYSTSLLEAVAAGVPVLYYSVNEQRFSAPFEGDPWLGPRTARSPEQLARLLADADLWRQPPPEGWLEYYLGPTDGRASERVLQAVLPSSARR